MIGLIPVGKFLEYHYLTKNFYNKKNKNDFDSILVLGGEEERVLHAINFHKLNKNSKIIFVTGSGFVIPNTYQELYEIKKFKSLVKETISEEDFFVIGNSRNTIENIVSFKTFNKKHQFKNTIVITSPYHYRRAMKISKKANIKLTPYYWMSPNSPSSVFQLFQQFSFSSNLRIFDRFFKELAGIFVLSVYKF